MSEIRPIVANKDTYKRQRVNFTNAAGDVVAKKNSTHHKTRNNIPKNLRYDLENALVGLCDVWFEEIKPYLIRNNIKVHGDAGGDLKRSASPDCSHVDPGTFNHRRQSRASCVDSSSTQQTASKAPSLKHVQRNHQVLAESKITTQRENQRDNCKKETVKKPRKRRKCQPQTQPRPLIPRLCRTISWQQNKEVYPVYSVNPVIKKPVRSKFLKQKNVLQTVDASTQTEEPVNFMKKCLKAKANINPELSKFTQRPATTTISHPKKNKHYTETPLFKNDISIQLKTWNSPPVEIPPPYKRLQLNNIVFKQYCVPVDILDIIAEKHDKMLKVLYTSPRKEEYPSSMNLFSPSTDHCKSKRYNKIPPWK